MDRGMKKALEKLDAARGDDIGASLKTVGHGPRLERRRRGRAPLRDVVPADGPAAAGKSELDSPGSRTRSTRASQGVIKRGKAEPRRQDDARRARAGARGTARPAGDDDVAGALGRAAEAAREGMEATVPMVARKGRASYLGERSAGHQDPGATSSHLLLKTVAEAVGSGGAAG